MLVIGHRYRLNKLHQDHLNSSDTAERLRAGDVFVLIDKSEFYSLPEFAFENDSRWTFCLPANYVSPRKPYCMFG